MYQERHREAIDYFKKALTLDPNYREAHLISRGFLFKKKSNKAGYRTLRIRLSSKAK